MPRYQSQGPEGCFEIRKVHPCLLRLSAVLRQLAFDKLLVLLPGVKWESDKHDALMVNRKIARFFARQFFHLLGYRRKWLDKTHWIIKNREAASRERDYHEAGWYQ